MATYRALILTLFIFIGIIGFAFGYFYGANKHDARIDELKRQVYNLRRKYEG